MKANNSLRQFVKDGLLGVAVALINPVILIGIFLFQSGLSPDNINIGALVVVLGILMLIAVLPTFIGTGIGGRLLENISSRSSWAKPMIILGAVSSLAWVILYAIFFAVVYYIFHETFMMCTTGGYNPAYANRIFAFSMESVLVVGVIGWFVGSLIGFLCGVIINPSKRQYRIIIGAVPGTLVGYTMVGLLMFFFLVSGCG